MSTETLASVHTHSLCFLYLCCFFNQGFVLILHSIHLPQQFQWISLLKCPHFFFNRTSKVSSNSSHHLDTTQMKHIKIRHILLFTLVLNCQESIWTITSTQLTPQVKITVQIKQCWECWTLKKKMHAIKINKDKHTLVTWCSTKSLLQNQI